MTNQIYLTPARKQFKTVSLPRLSKQNIKKAETIAVWGSIISTLMMAISQQPLFSLPVSLCLGLNLLSRQQQAQIERQLVANNAQIERVTNQYSSAITASEFQASLAVKSQQIQQFQQQLSQLSDQVTNTTSINTPIKKRVAIFIDGSNLYYALNQLNTRIDYTKFLQILVREDTLYRAIYYTGIDSNSDKEHGFIKGVPN
ncbi:NYN domain-containing protein [Waterburya agarophytonicola K14]|uniref:NYN domain-containing protein n=1 Tax=Waterburya agarophytonicola KI4 TaxID=2874699 RepID=A0A964FLK5_9CYAN|nr:NYN domain-containing protein [Waterburya agarophytonicola]MCC0179849.1 NYN domain-containing protein [Waterburya agarophytonicola KI4]